MLINSFGLVLWIEFEKCDIDKHVNFIQGFPNQLEKIAFYFIFSFATELARINISIVWDIFLVIEGTFFEFNLLPLESLNFLHISHYLSVYL